MVYHHRGAYLNAVCNIVTWGMPQHAVYLWTLPMFHCNGWCFPWTMAANAGTNVCLRKVEAQTIFDADQRAQGHALLRRADRALHADQRARGAEAGHRRTRCSGMVAAAAPPAAMIEGMERMGFDITHVYGLTEVYGPATVCAKHEEWDDARHRRARAAQRPPGRALPDGGGPDGDGPGDHAAGAGRRRDHGRDHVPRQHHHEGLPEEPEGDRRRRSRGGWFHSGDLAVMQPDGYVKIKDRSKDIIISGGENISSLEVEDVLYRHPAVLAAAVVAKPDEKWGETPCAFVELKPGANVTEKEIIEFCRQHLASFKAPRAVVFGELPEDLDRQDPEVRAAREGEVHDRDRHMSADPATRPARSCCAKTATASAR